MQHIEVSGARLAVADSGGDGPTLIALHAGVADSRIWYACVPAWTAAGWRVITYDRRGYGRSTWQDQPHQPIADLLAVMDALQVPSAVLVGNSMGGLVSLQAALDAPGRVAGLVLVAPAVTGAPYPFGAEGDPGEEELDEAAEAAEEAGDIDEANRLSAHLWLDGPRQAEGRVDGAARELFLDMNGTAMRAPETGDTDWGDDPAWPRLEQITAPTLMVLGAHDMTICLEWGREMARVIPPAVLVELPGSAHLPMLDDPEAFLAAVEPFLTEVQRDLVAGGSPPNPI